ncbi:MAG TPA: hypothetical protein VGQ65_05605 [Thermoanaerobaculia bacterium]|jgi:hypothetical protein|nr:hypothetical protein [Thermoanaerobaculia bacterium]
MSAEDNLVVNFTGAATSLSASFDYRGTTYPQADASIELFAFGGETTGSGTIDLFWTDPATQGPWSFGFTASLGSGIQVSRLSVVGPPGDFICPDSNMECASVTWLSWPAGLVGDWRVSMSGTVVDRAGDSLVVQFDKVSFTVPQSAVAPSSDESSAQQLRERKDRRRHP